jgi:hypothetical protein
MDSEERKRLFRQIMWDYHIPPEEVEAVFEGKQTRAGHYTRETLFVKLLESYSWFTIVGLFHLNDIRDMLTDSAISKLRSKSLREKYAYVQKRLHEIIPAAG